MFICLFHLENIFLSLSKRVTCFSIPGFKETQIQFQTDLRTYSNKNLSDTLSSITHKTQIIIQLVHPFYQYDTSKTKQDMINKNPAHYPNCNVFPEQPLRLHKENQGRHISLSNGNVYSRQTLQHFGKKLKVYLHKNIYNLQNYKRRGVPLHLFPIRYNVAAQFVFPSGKDFCRC